MFCLTLASILATFVAPDGVPAHPTLDKLAAEAETLKHEQPEHWRQYQQRADRIFVENENVVDRWKKRSAPPQPDLTPLQLPLAFLADALRQAENRQKPPQALAVVKRRDPRTRHFAYLSAIVHSADERRILALLEYNEHYLRLAPENKQFYSWGKLLADAATLPWAAAQIVELAGQNPPLEYTRRFDNLLYCLIERFAPKLPADAEKAAYAYLRKQAPDGPTSYATEQIWDVLFRLDSSRARQEILPYFTRPNFGSLRYNIYVVALLARHMGPSPEVAAAVHQWLATQADLTEFNKRQLRVVLLRADPERELKATVKHIDELLAVQQQKHERFEMLGDVHLLVLALGDVALPAADEPLARYVFERAIDAGVRFLILESLVRRHYARSPDLAARWLAEEPEHLQRHLRQEATEKWGSYGRELLKKAEQLNGQNRPDADAKRQW